MILSKQDSAYLWDLYESEGYQALVRLLEARKVDLAIQSLNSADMNQLSQIKGRVQEIDWILAEISKNYKNRSK